MRPTLRNAPLIIFAVAVVTACILFIGVGLHRLPAIEMSSHGWVALVLGVGVSIILGAGLSAVLIIGRRRGFDETAHQAVLDEDPQS